MPVNLHHLRLFVAVVEEGGVLPAARAMNLSQPGVSRAIHDLEKQLGLDLFERTSRRLELTEAGREVYDQARAVFVAERGVADVVQDLKGLRRGILRIGASTTIATYVLPASIAEFTRRHPHVELRLSAVHTRVLVDMLHRYELDVALAEAPVTDDAIAVSPWRVDEMVAIAGAHHRLAGKKRIPTSELDKELIILRERESGTRDIVVRALREAGVSVRRSMSVDGTEVIKQVVAEGMGVAIVSRFAIVDQLARKRLVVLDVPALKITRPFNRLSLRQRKPSLLASAFLALITEA